ncbi:MAG: hypothetical protein IKV16_04895 [Clostridia bacterium]|nr:hypothetical protein [Clostridia bacterium]
MLEKCNHRRFFTKDSKFYKVNLNCHTNISNGQYMPWEIKDLYKSQGYSAVAFSDSEAIVSHDDLTDDDFIALKAVELTVEEECGKKVYLNAIALSPDSKEPTIERKSPMNDAEIKELIRAYKDSGFFVICNHPRKSLARLGKGTPYEELDAIEIINYSSLTEGINEYNENLYEDILKGGVRPAVIAADGNKNDFPYGNRKCDSCGAYVMIQAEKLTYQAIADALKNGRYYSTEGPEIYAMWYRSEVLYVRCSPADKIIFESGARRDVIYAEDGKPLDGQGICFWVMPEHSYARVTIVDKNGKKAFTNAFDATETFYTYEKA